MLLALTKYELGLLVVAAVFVVFALVVALVIPRSRPDFPGKSLWAFVAVCVALFAAQLTAVLVDSRHEQEDEAVTTETETTTTETETTEPESAGAVALGKEVFLGTSGCGNCHTLADAGTTGAIGPNLDATKPSSDKVVERVTNGQGVMPSFAGSLSEERIQDVAAYVSTVAGT